jgi:hypothetical protein
VQRKESVSSILGSEATGKVAEIYADIRQVLGTSIVNLIWRNLATIPGALEWTWSAAKPLYLGPGAGYSESVRRAIDLPVVRLIEELNGFGEDTDKSLIASMYRHLGYWPTYLSLVRTMHVPLETNGQLHALTPSTRALARSHGRALASTPPDTLQQTLAACRRFVNYPMGLKRLANWRLDMRRTSCSCGWTVPTSSRCALR